MPTKTAYTAEEKRDINRVACQVNRWRKKQLDAEKEASRMSDLSALAARRACRAFHRQS